MKLFTVNGVDFTSFIPVPDYEINRKDIYSEWVNADYRHNRHIQRTRVEGKIKLIFRNNDDYYNFIATLKGCKQAGGDYSPVCLYINNENEVAENLSVYITFETKNYQPVSSLSENEGFEIEIRER